MAFEFRQTLRVEFADTDMAGIVHFSKFFRYMEETEHAFLRSLGLSVHVEIDGRIVSWPRVSAQCSYRAPLRFEDEFEVRLLVREKRRSSLAYEFLFSRCDNSPPPAAGVEGTAGRQDRVTVAEGRMEVVCATLDRATGRMTVVPIPPLIGEKIEAACEELDPL